MVVAQSVTAHDITRRVSRAASLFLSGLADDYFSMAVTGVAVMFAALLLQLIWPLRVYVLILRASSGDVDAVTSRNKEFVSNLQKAVEQAFVVRAREPSVSEGGGSR